MLRRLFVCGTMFNKPAPSSITPGRPLHKQWSVFYSYMCIGVCVMDDASERLSTTHHWGGGGGGGGGFVDT